MERRGRVSTLLLAHRWFNMPAMLKGWFDKTLVPGPGGAWDFPKPGVASSAGLAGLVPLLTNVKRIAAVSTCALHARIPLPARPPAARSVVAGRYGAPHHIAMLAGDNGRNTVWPPRPNADDLPHTQRARAVTCTHSPRWPPRSEPSSTRRARASGSGCTAWTTPGRRRGGASSSTCAPPSRATSDDTLRRVRMIADYTRRC